MPEKRDEREEKLIASEAKAMKLLDERTKRFSSLQTKKDMENKELKVNLKTEVDIFQEDKKGAVKEMKAAMVVRIKKAETKAFATKKEAETSLAQSKRKSSEAQ